MNKLALVFFTIVFAWSCTSVNIQKRRYERDNQRKTFKECIDFNFICHGYFVIDSNRLG